MDKKIDCRNLGSDCAYTACARTEAELFKEVLEHGSTIHGMKEFSQGFYNKVRSSIQDGYCDLDEELCKHSDCWLAKKDEEDRLN